MSANVARYFRPAAVAGLEALHADFAAHSYRPHSHPTWTIAVVERGAAKFELEDTRQRADRGDLFVLEPGAVHTGTGAVPEGWAYKVLYLEPELIGGYADGDGPVAQTARWVVFRDPALRRSLLHVHAALAGSGSGVETLALEEACLFALDALSRHLRPLPAALIVRVQASLAASFAGCRRGSDQEAQKAFNQLMRRGCMCLRHSPERVV